MNTGRRLTPTAERRTHSVLAALLLAALLFSSVAAGAHPPAAAKVQVLIAFSHTPGPAEQALVRGAGGEIKYTYHLVPAIAATVPEAALDGLRRNPRVVAVEPDGQAHLLDTELENAWGVQRIGAGTVHSQGNRGLGIKVGILDSGIDLTHSDLTYDPACSHNYIEGESLHDEHSHGTHVAGILAALDNDSGVVGVAPEATLCIYKIFDSGGGANYSDILAAVQQAMDDGVQITNNSWGDEDDPGSTVKAAFDNAYAAGVLHVAGAGNSDFLGMIGNTCIYPALWDSVMATGATTQSDGLDWVSSTCPELELAAPGTNVYSTIPNNSYGSKSGTSMAAPHVAGTAALVWAANPGWSLAQVRSRLQATAEDLGNPGRDTWFGYGLVDADEAAAPSGDNAPPVAGDQAVTTDEDTPVAITLTASDPDGGDTLTYSIVTGPAHGQLSGDAPELIYTPDPDSYGSDSFTFVANDGLVDSNEATVSITINPANDPPLASFSYACTELACSFDGLASSDPDGSVVSYGWDFGDGSTATGATAGHTYGTAGTYGVMLTVTEDGDATDIDIQSLTVSAAAPGLHIADLDGSLADGNKNFWWASVTLTVHDQEHNPVAGASVSGAWSGGASGSGSCLTGAGGACSILSPKISTAQPSITFAVDGVTHPSLPYEPAANHDPDGDSDGTSVLVSQAGNLPPLASFTYSCTDLTCDFDGSGSTDPDGSVVSYAWDLGDGTSATGPSPSHTYAAAGTYPVILTVTDNEGATGDDSQAVSAGGSPAATMFVQDISLSGKAAGPNRTATAVVTIRDTNGNPVPGATVYATWSGDDSGSVSGVTAADGTVAFTSGRVRHADATFTFSVNDVAHGGFTYSPSLNVETSDTLIVP